MFLQPSPQNKAGKIIKRLKKGKGGQDDVNSLLRLVSGDKNADEILGQVKTALRDTPPENSLYLLQVIRIVTEAAPHLTIDLIPPIIRTLEDMREEQREREIPLEAIITLFYISKHDPTAVEPAIPILLEYLDNHFDKIRVSSFCTLKSISEENPGAFTANTEELLDALHGLNNDARIFAAEIIGDIASENPEVVDAAYKSLDRLLKHPSSRVRSGAGRAIKKLIMTERRAHPIEEIEITGDGKYGKLSGMEDKFKAEADKILKSIGLEHLKTTQDEKTRAKQSAEQSSILKEVKKGDLAPGEETQRLLGKIIGNLMAHDAILLGIIFSNTGKPLVMEGEAEDEFITQIAQAIDLVKTMEGTHFSMDLKRGRLVALQGRVGALVVLIDKDAEGPVLYEVHRAAYKAKNVLTLS